MFNWVYKIINTRPIKCNFLLLFKIFLIISTMFPDTYKEMSVEDCGMISPVLHLLRLFTTLLLRQSRLQSPSALIRLPFHSLSQLR